MSRHAQCWTPHDKRPASPPAPALALNVTPVSLQTKALPPKPVVMPRSSSRDKLAPGSAAHRYRSVVSAPPVTKPGVPKDTSKAGLFESSSSTPASLAQCSSDPVLLATDVTESTVVSATSSSTPAEASTPSVSTTATDVPEVQPAVAAVEVTKTEVSLSDNIVVSADIKSPIAKQKVAEPIAPQAPKAPAPIHITSPSKIASSPLPSHTAPSPVKTAATPGGSTIAAMIAQFRQPSASPSRQVDPASFWWTNSPRHGEQPPTSRPISGAPPGAISQTPAQRGHLDTFSPPVSLAAHSVAASPSVILSEIPASAASPSADSVMSPIWSHAPTTERRKALPSRHFDDDMSVMSPIRESYQASPSPQTPSASTVSAIAADADDILLQWRRTRQQHASSVGLKVEPSIARSMESKRDRIQAERVQTDEWPWNLLNEMPAAAKIRQRLNGDSVESAAAEPVSNRSVQTSTAFADSRLPVVDKSSAPQLPNSMVTHAPNQFPFPPFPSSTADLLPAWCWMPVAALYPTGTPHRPNTAVADTQTSQEFPAAGKNSPTRNEEPVVPLADSDSTRVDSLTLPVTASVVAQPEVLIAADVNLHPAFVDSILALSEANVEELESDPVPRADLQRQSHVDSASSSLAHSIETESLSSVQALIDSLGSGEIVVPTEQLSHVESPIEPIPDASDHLPVTSHVDASALVSAPIQTLIEDIAPEVSAKAEAAPETDPVMALPVQHPVAEPEPPTVIAVESPAASVESAPVVDIVVPASKSVEPPSQSVSTPVIQVPAGSYASKILERMPHLMHDPLFPNFVARLQTLKS